MNNLAVVTSKAPVSKKYKDIFDAATRLFFEGGLEGVTIDDIANSAGVSKQTIYNNFSSKVNLFEVIFHKKCKEHAINTARIFHQVYLPPEELLLQLAEDLLMLMVSDDFINMTRLCVSPHKSTPSVSKAFYDAVPLNIIKGLETYLDAQVRKGVMIMPDTKYAAMQFYNMVKSDSVCRELMGLAQDMTDHEINAYLGSCVTLFLSEYKA